jgi:hypothetical protein
MAAASDQAETPSWLMDRIKYVGINCLFIIFNLFVR